MKKQEHSHRTEQAMNAVLVAQSRHEPEDAQEQGDEQTVAALAEG